MFEFTYTLTFHKLWN